MTSPVIPDQRPQANAAHAARPDWMEHVLVYGPFVLLLFGPLAFGAVSPFPIFVLEAGAAALFLLWIVRQVNSGEIAISWNPLFAPMIAFLFVIALQLATKHTGYRYATYSDAMLYIAYGLLCFVIVQTLRRTSHLRHVAIAVSAFGFAVALFALLQSASSQDKLYWLIKPHNGGWVYGPYVNHNHYAGLMEMLIPVPLVIAFSHFAHGTGKRLAIIAAAIMSATLFLSGSRGGMIAFLVELAILALFLVRERSKSKFRMTWMFILFPIIMVCLLAWLGGSELANRVTSINTETRTEISGGVRMQIARDGLRMFKQKPLLGYGLDTFPEIYPEFRSFYTDIWINEAHDDYLQLLIETGALGFCVMLWFLCTMYSHAAKKLAGWPSNLNGTLALAAMLGCTGILVHSFVDFNLHIPANAAIFYTLCALAAMEPRFRKHFHRERNRTIS
jgi:O-antigen ligase